MLDISGNIRHTLVMVNEVNGHSEHGSRDMTPMTYEAFAKLYHE